MSLLRYALQDARAKPEIIPLLTIMAGAVTGASSFLLWRVFGTPDIQVRSAEFNFERKFGHGIDASINAPRGPAAAEQVKHSPVKLH